MTLSEMIAKLQAILAERGDLPTSIIDDGVEESDLAIVVREADGADSFRAQYGKVKPVRVIIESTAYVD